jgi:hypothetical protein
MELVIVTFVLKHFMTDCISYAEREVATSRDCAKQIYCSAEHKPSLTHFFNFPLTQSLHSQSTLHHGAVNIIYQPTCMVDSSPYTMLMWQHHSEGMHFAIHCLHEPLLH